MSEIKRSSLPVVMSAIFVDEATGVKYHHIIDPKTGYSANNGLISVTIVSADSTLADGLSTSLFVLGTEDAIAYCEEHCAEDGFDAIMEDEDGNCILPMALWMIYQYEQYGKYSGNQDKVNIGR